MTEIERGVTVGGAAGTRFLYLCRAIAPMKTKYTPEIVERILSVFRETGSDKVAYLAANISKDTFYKWKLNHPDFADLLAIAAVDFRMRAPESYIEQAKKTLEDYLFNGETQTWSSREIHKDANGNIIKIVEKVSKVVKSTPCWVIDRVLGKSYDELEAVKTLVEAGWLPPEILYRAGASMEKLKTAMQQLFKKV